MSVIVATPPAPVTDCGVERASPPAPALLRLAAALDAPSIHALISACRAEGHLLPRDPGEIAVHARRFTVACCGEDIVACAELAPLSRELAEVRSLVVNATARARGLGARLVDSLARRAVATGFTTLCAFTHVPSFWVRSGFSIVPHVWLPEKIVTDCHACSRFRACGQFAVVRSLGRHTPMPASLPADHG